MSEKSLKVSIVKVSIKERIPASLLESKTARMKW